MKAKKRDVAMRGPKTNERYNQKEHADSIHFPRRISLKLVHRNSGCCGACSRVRWLLCMLRTTKETYDGVGLTATLQKHVLHFAR